MGMDTVHGLGTGAHSAIDTGAHSAIDMMAHSAIDDMVADLRVRRMQKEIRIKSAIIGEMPR